MQSKVTLSFVVKCAERLVVAANDMAAKLGLPAPHRNLAHCLNVFMVSRGCPDGATYSAIVTTVLDPGEARRAAPINRPVHVLRASIVLEIVDERAFRKAARRHAKKHSDTRIIHPRHFLYPKLTTLCECTDELFFAHEDPPGTHICTSIASGISEAA
jgi:hypothetical protein